MKNNRYILILLLCTSFLYSAKAQSYPNDLWWNSMYHSGQWVFNANAFMVNSKIDVHNVWYGINIQHFPTRPNLSGNNLFSINMHINFSPDFRILQFSTGGIFGLCASAILTKGTNQYKYYYQRYLDMGYDPESASDAAGSQVNVSEQEYKAMIIAFLLALESGSFHFPLGGHVDLSIDWSAFKVNYHFKDKKWFFTADVGSSFGVSLGKHVLLKVSGGYTFNYKRKGYLDRGWYEPMYINWGWNGGVSIGYK